MSLEIICPDRWGAESTVRAPGGLVFVSRMTVVRLPDGRLWLSSPVEIDAARQRALREIGPVAFIVAPNGFHHLYAMPAKATFPDATLWASPAFRRRKHPVTPDHWLGDATPPWSSTSSPRGSKVGTQWSLESIRRTPADRRRRASPRSLVELVLQRSGLALLSCE